MPCLDFPKLPVPQLPSPLTLGTPAFSVGLGPIDAKLCCNVHIPLPSIPIPPLPLGVVTQSFLTLLLADVGVVNGFLSQLNFDCPLNEDP